MTSQTFKKKVKNVDGKKNVKARLMEELERLKGLLGLDSGLKVVWMPYGGRGLSGEVKDGIIYVYERETDTAVQVLRHELIDYLITSMLVEPLVSLINTLIKSRETEIYREKEKLVKALSRLLISTC